MTSLKLATLACCGCLVGADSSYSAAIDEGFSSAAARTKFWRTVYGFALSFALSLALALRFLRAVRWRFSRVPGYFAAQTPRPLAVPARKTGTAAAAAAAAAAAVSLSSHHHHQQHHPLLPPALSLSYPATLRWLGRAARFYVVVVPAAILASWAAVIIVAVRPRLVGVGLLLLPSALGLCVYGLSAWRSRRWRLGNAALLKCTLGLAFALLVAFEFTALLGAASLQYVAFLYSRLTSAFSFFYLLTHSSSTCCKPPGTWASAGRFWR
jgi:hypothetical protein